MSDSVRPHRWQPTKLPHPWDSSGKNWNGCHFLLQCMKVKSESEVTQSCPSLQDPRDCSLPASSIHGIFQALRNIITNKFSGGDGIPVELFQILEDGAVKVLHSICQKIWKTSQWPQDWKRCLHSNPKDRPCQRMLKLPHNGTHVTC